jgi:hypothetical protein
MVPRQLKGKSLEVGAGSVCMDKFFWRSCFFLCDL